jgi:hypothetical protein
MRTLHPSVLRIVLNPRVSRGVNGVIAFENNYS